MAKCARPHTYPNLTEDSEKTNKEAVGENKEWLTRRMEKTIRDARRERAEIEREKRSLGSAMHQWKTAKRLAGR